VPTSRTRPDLAALRADDPEGDPVAVAHEVLGQRRRGAHRHVEAAGRAADPARTAEVGQRVDDEQHPAVLLGG
jgi:hypothetical protein